MKVTHNNLPHPGLVDKAQGADKAVAKKGTETGRSSSVSPHAAEGTSVQISDEAKLMQEAKKIAASAPDIRAERVAALKKAVKNGTYQVDAEKVADKLVDDHLATDFGKNNL